MFNRSKKFTNRQHGQAFVEYFILTAAIAVAMIMVLDKTSSAISGTFQRAAQSTNGINFETMGTEEEAAPEETEEETAAGYVIPIFECVEKHGNTYTAHFGYDNPNSFAVSEPVGNENMFTGAANDQGQPTTFQPGRHEDVFTVSWNGNGHSNLAWRLFWQASGHADIQEATADNTTFCD